MTAIELEKKPLIECLESLGRGQSPTYIEEESGIFAINQKCVRNGAVDALHSRPHDQKIRVKDSALLQDGDVCINSTGTGTIGRVGLWSSKGLHNGTRYFADSHVTIARPNKEVINPKYLAALLESTSVQTAMETYCFSGSTNQVELNRTALETLKISILGREAQNKVATILSTLDRVIEQTEAITAKQQRIKAGLMQDLLTKGIDEHGVIRTEATHEFKDSPLGRIPVEWEVEALGSVIEIIDPNPSHRYPPSSDVGVPIASTENFVGDNGFDLSWADRVPLSVFEKQRQRCNYIPDDVIFARKGRLGFARPYGNEDKVFSHTVVVLKPRNGSVSPRFILWMVRFRQFFDEIDKRMNSNSGVPTLGVAFIGAVPVLIPKPEEQARIVALLDNAEVAAEKELMQLQKIKKVKTGLMHDLLTGTVRVANH